MELAEVMLEQDTWAVVGSHGRNPIADRLVHKLQSHGKKVFRVNPKSPGEDGVYKALHDVPGKIQAVDMVINPYVGISVVEDAAALGIEYIWIQPGAESPALLARAKELNLQVHQGCVLRELV